MTSVVVRFRDPRLPVIDRQAIVTLGEVLAAIDSVVADAVAEDVELARTVYCAGVDVLTVLNDGGRAAAVNAVRYY